MNTRAARILEKLKSVVQDQSGFGLEELDENSTLLELGFDSLFLTQLASAFHNEFGVRITFRQLFDEIPTMNAIAAHIDASLPPETTTAPPAAAPVPPAVANPVAPPATVRATSRPAMPRPNLLAVGSAASLDDSSLSVLQAVMAQQLEVMAQQIQMLRGIPAEEVMAPAAVVEAPAVAAPASAGPAIAAVPAAAEAPALTAAAASTPAPATMPAGFGPRVTPTRDGRALSPKQREHLDSLVARYTAKTAGSRLLTQRYRSVHADPRTAAGFNRLWKEMVYPIVVKRSSGSRLWDVDDNEYIDILNGFGPNFLGHSPSYITEALLAQLQKGIEVGPQTPHAGEVARLFCEMTGMDRASFVNTGSEAVQAAIRLSRTITGRNTIVVFAGDYHGNFDEVLVRVAGTGEKRRTVPLAPGIPQRAVDGVLVLDYGSEEALDIIRARAKEIAAVLVEPVQSRRPDFQPREFLHALRKLTEEEGVVLVFDEVITGFRICPGGAQEYYGIEADLATYGKIVGGGMPIGVVAGRSRFMDTFDGGMWQYGDDSFPSVGVTFFAGTFVRHPLAISAAHAALTYLKKMGPSLQQSVNDKASRFTGELNRFFDENGLKIRYPHFSSQMYLKVQEDSELANLLFFHLRYKGIHLLEGFPTYMTAAHTDEDVDALIRAFKESIWEMQEAEILPRPEGVVPPALPPRRLALTSAQREIWMASQLGDFASCAFNESDTMLLEGALDAPLLQRAAAEVLSRHEAFKLRFDDSGSEQWLDRNAAFDVPIVDLSEPGPWPPEERLTALLDREALTPFDLAQGPLVRARVVRLALDRHVFLIYSHHIVFDGWSAEVVVREIAQTYSALRRGDTPALPAAVPFSTYAARADRARREDSYEASLQYWQGVYAPEPPAPLDLPTDRPHPAVRSFRGGTVHHEIPKDPYDAIRAACKKMGITLYVFLLSGFEVLLSRLCNQGDLVVGLPAAGQAIDEEDAVGYCVNVLPLRSRLEGNASFADFAKANHRAVLDAFENQRPTLGEIVARLGLPRDPSRVPLIEAVFNCSRYFGDVAFEGLTLKSRENPRRAVFHDLFLNIIESGDQLVVDWDYNADILDAETVRRWVRHLEVLVGAAARNPEIALDALPLMTDDEVEEMRAQWKGAVS